MVEAHAGRTVGCNTGPSAQTRQSSGTGEAGKQRARERPMPHASTRAV